MPVRGDVEANLEQHVRLVDVAANEHAGVVVFPELSLIGYELDVAAELAFSESDPRLAPLVELAASHSMTLVVGAPIGIDSRLYLGAFILSPDRRIEIYTKHYLGAFSSDDNPGGAVPPPEPSVFHPGDRNPLLNVASGSKAAVAICADVGRPAHAKAAADRGAQTFLASMFVSLPAFENDTSNLRTYAARHSMAVVFANYGGPSGGVASAGRSSIWSETGDLLAQLAPTGSGVAVAIESDRGWRRKTVMLDAS
jgi:predicted amidohydrolase